MSKLFAILVSTLVLQGCTYAVSPPFREKADRSITFDQLLADPDLYKGKILILGGTIVETSVKPKGTLITLTERPLDYWGKPIRTTRTGGRFLLFHPDALDAFPYAPGRELTVAAEVVGTKLGPLGNQEFIDPVLIIKEIKLWERTYPAAGAPRWGDPLYDRYQQPGRPQ